MKIPERSIFWAKEQAEKGRRVRPVGFKGYWLEINSMHECCWSDVFAEWEAEPRKPEVVEFEWLPVPGTMIDENLFQNKERLSGRRWRIVATEVIDE